MYNFKEPKEAYEISRRFTKEGSSAGVIEFPPYITLELISACNFRCIMCPTSYMERERKEMDFELFKKIVDEISKYGSLIRFIGFEEPLLYGRIKDAIKYVKDRGLLLHITTNGSLLNEGIIKVIVDNQVDSIIFSFQGLTEKEYCFMRNTTPATYVRVIKNIKMLYKSRQSKKPYIKITTTITERDSPADKEKFAREHLGYVDEAQITGFTHFVHIAELYDKKNIWKELGISKPQKLNGVKCFSPSYDLFIKGDGSVHMCCGAYTDSLKIGNATGEKIFGIWHSGKAGNIRELLKKGDLDKIANCAVCPMRYKYENIDSTPINTKRGAVEKFLKEKE